MTQRLNVPEVAQWAMKAMYGLEGDWPNATWTLPCFTY
jgi:hypothetical protein